MSIVILAEPEAVVAEAVVTEEVTEAEAATEPLVKESEAVQMSDVSRSFNR